MFCWLTKRLISDHLDGKLSSREEERLFRHLKSCSRCRAYFASLQILQTKIGSSLSFQVPKDYWEESLALIRKKLEAEKERRLSPGKRKWFGEVSWRFGWALTTVLLAVLAFYLLLPRPKSSQPVFLASAEMLSSFIEQVEADSSFIEAFNEALEAEIRELAWPEGGYINYIENHALILEELSDEEIDLLLLEVQNDRGEGR